MSAAMTGDSPCGLRAAVAPPEATGARRDSVRLLVSGADGDEHTTFASLPAHLQAGDLLVVNNSRTRKSAVDIVDSSLTVHFSSRMPGGGWIVEFRSHGGRRPHRGLIPASAQLPDGSSLHVAGPYNDDHSVRLWKAHVTGDATSMLREHGRWVRYDYLRDGPVDDGWYQTVFADKSHTGAAAEMPSAGRPFTEAVLRAIRERGVGVRSLLLHCGVSSQDAGETPHAEWYDVPRETLEAVRRTHADGGRVVAVGTTVVRALETVVRTGERRGWTTLLLGSTDRVRGIDGILSGFHPPDASHLDLLRSVVGGRIVDRSYGAACERGYLSHEFGDSHLLLSAQLKDR